MLQPGFTIAAEVIQRWSRHLAEEPRDCPLHWASTMSQASEELCHKWLNQQALLSQKDTLTSGMFSCISSCRKRSINTHQKRSCGRQWIRKDNFSRDRHEGENSVGGSSCEAYGFQSPAKSFGLLCDTVVRCLWPALTLKNSIPRAQWLCFPIFILPLWEHYRIWAEVRF